MQSSVPCFSHRQASKLPVRYSTVKREAVAKLGHAERIELRASTSASGRADLIVEQNSNLIGERKRTSINEDQVWVQRRTRAGRRRVRWSEHGWRWRQHQDGRTYALGTRDSRRTSGNHLGNPRERREKRPDCAIWRSVDSPRRRRRKASLRAVPLSHTLHRHDRRSPPRDGAAASTEQSGGVCGESGASPFLSAAAAFDLATVRSHNTRWHTQVIGPGIPASWLHHIDDDTCDDISDDNLETWWEADLPHSSDIDEPHDGYRQIAIVRVMMGDTNAVSVLEMADKRQLINAGVLRTDTLLLPERPLPQSNEFGDVYIDDLVLFSILHFSDGQLSVSTVENKGTADFRAEFWSVLLDGIAGTLGFSMRRRSSVMYVVHLRFLDLVFLFSQFSLSRFFFISLVLDLIFLAFFLLNFFTFLTISKIFLNFFTSASCFVPCGF